MSRACHEWPLVLFSTLATAGAGLMASRVVLEVSGVVAPANRQAIALASGALMAAGGAASLIHLGRWRRAPLASRRVGSSWLSTEAVLVVLTLLTTVAVAVRPGGPASPDLIAFNAGVLAVAVLIAIGCVYRLRGQVTWMGLAWMAPLVSGLVAGVVVHAATDAQAWPRLWPWLAVLVTVDVGVTLWRWRTVARVPRDCPPQHPAVFSARHVVMAGRLLAVSVLPVMLLASAQGVAAVVVLALGLLTDRIAFYGLAVQHTTESEIAWVEALIERL